MEKSWGEGSSGREEGREAGMEEARGPKYLKGGGVRGRPCSWEGEGAPREASPGACWESLKPGKRKCGSARTQTGREDASSPPGDAAPPGERLENPGQEAQPRTQGAKAGCGKTYIHSGRQHSLGWFPS